MTRSNPEIHLQDAVASGERVAEPLRQQAERLKSAVAETIDEQLRGARRSLRRTRHAAEDLTDDVRMYTRHRPLATLGMALAVGAVIGLVVGWAARPASRR